MQKLFILIEIVILTGVIIAGLSTNISAEESLIPVWIKNNAGWWADGKINDDSFVQGIQFLIKEKIMSIPSTQSSGTGSNEIPSWIKNNAGWWADDQISDTEFISALQFLVKEGILIIPDGNNSQKIQSQDFVSEEIKGLFPFRYELGTEWVIELNTEWENNIENTIGNQVYYYNPTVAGFNTPEVWVTIWKFDNLDAPADELDYVYSEKVVKAGGFTEVSVPKSPFEFDKECYSIQRILDGGREMVVIECYLKDSPFYVSVVITGDPWDFKTERDLDWFPTANKFMTASLDKVRDLKH